MKHFKIFLLLFWVSLTGRLQAQVNFFKGDWKGLLAEAKKQNKPIWIDFYAVWCGPCKMMDKQTFQNTDVGNYSNANYIAYKIDAEKGEGPELADKFRIEAYPTIVILDPDGNHLANEVGMKMPNDFIAVLKKYQTQKGQATEQSETQFFKGTWNELLQQAQKTGKPFWVDFYAVWCGPCKMMSNKTFKDPQVANFSNKQFIAYKLDCEKGEGPQISTKYKISAYPTIIAFDANGNEILRNVGFLDAGQFQAWLQKALDKAGKKAPKGQGNANSPHYEFNDYWKLKNASLQNLNQILFPTQEEQQKYQTAYQLGLKKDDFNFEEEMIKWKLPKEQQWKYWTTFFFAAKKMDKVLQILSPLFEQQALNDNELHWIALQSVSIQESKPEIIKWLNHAIRNNPDPDKFDTKAALYYLAGKPQDAYESASTALKQNNKSETSAILKQLADQALLAKQ